MMPEGKFATILASIAAVFVFSLVSLFATYTLYSKKDFLEGFNIFEATGSGKSLKGLNQAVRR